MPQTAREPSPRRVSFVDGGAEPDAPPAAPPARPKTDRPPLHRGSSKERMAELTELLKEGFITQDEFVGKRQAILDAI